MEARGPPPPAALRARPDRAHQPPAGQTRCFPVLTHWPLSLFRTLHATQACAEHPHFSTSLLRPPAHKAHRDAPVHCCDRQPPPACPHRSGAHLHNPRYSPPLFGFFPLAETARCTCAQCLLPSGRRVRHRPEALLGCERVLGTGTWASCCAR